MSFPNIIFGPEGEQFHRYTAKRWPLGTALWLKGGDQRFRFAGTGATALSGGRLMQGEALSSQWDTFINGAATPAGATTISLQSGQANSSFAANKFADGWLIAVTSTVSTPGLYRIASHPAQGTTGVATKFTLAGGYGLPEALSSGTTFALHQNDFKDVVVSSTGAGVGARLVGVTPTSLSSAAFGWLQTAGPAPVLSDGSVAIGNAAVPSTAVAGAVTSPTSTAFSTASFNPTVCLPVGEFMAQTTTTKFALVMLRIDG